MRRLVLHAAAAALVAAGCSEDPGPGIRRGDEIERRIRFYSGKIEQRPRLYPVHVQLGAAYFDKARETGDPRWLAEARRSLDRSVSIVATHEAFVTMARVANYAHRFEDAIRLGRRAMPPAGSPDAPDPGVVAILVEAHSALGQYAEARALLPPGRAPAADFFTAVAFGGWFASQRRHEEAARAYVTAAERAHAEDALQAAAWARAMAAGMLLDAGRPDQARPHLEAARRIDPAAVLLRLHEAEWHQSQGSAREALAIYEVVLRDRPHDPEMHAVAWRVARRLGVRDRARSHFAAAERGFRQAVDAGEIYTLGALAQLYCDDGSRVDEAVGLARRNILFRRDGEALETLAAAQGGCGRSGSRSAGSPVNR